MELYKIYINFTFKIIYKMGKREHTDEIIKKHVLWSMGAGLIPLPLLDVAAVTAIQIDMFKQLSNAYSKDFSDVQGKAIVSSLAGNILSKLGSDSLKLIPGFGNLMSNITMSALSGATSYALAQVYIKYLEEGGTFFDMETPDVKKFFTEQLEKGKEYVSDLSNKKHDSFQNRTLDKLREITVLRDNGTLTEEEYQKMKDKLIEEF